MNIKMNIKILILLGSLISGFVFFSGCVQEKALKVPTESPIAQPTIEKQGCSPAFVVNINTKLVEINWRCKGAILQNR